MKTLAAIFLMVLFVSGFLISQTDNYKELMLSGKQLVEQGNTDYDIGSIMKGKAILERALLLNSSDEYALYYLAYADYSLATISMQNNKTKAGQYIDEAIDYGKKAIEANNKSAESLALLGTIYGVKVSLDWKNTMEVGPKSNAVIAQAMALAPDNPRVLLQAGINKMFTPEFYGGSKEEAFKLFQKSVKAFDTYTVKDSLAPDWGNLQSLAWLGRAYVGQKNYEKAIEVYKKALSINPEYKWVKYILLPEAEQKLGQ